MIALFLFLPSAGSIDFYVDPVVYRTTIAIKDTITQTTQTESIFYIEFNCEIPYQELYYETIDDNITTRATVVFKLSSLSRPDSLIDTIYRQFTIPSFSGAAEQQMSFIIQFGLHVPEDKFAYEIETSSGSKKGIMKKEIEIVKEQYKTSDLLLASGIVSDTTEDYLRKGNLKVIPHPSHVFNEYYSNLYVYYEIYDITPDTDSLEITYTIVNKKDDKIIRKISRHIEKKFESQAVNFGLNIKTFNPGDYIFCVTVRDPDTEVVVDKMIPFQIKKTVQKEVSYKGLPYYEEIKYFLPPRDYKYFQSLPKEGKEIFLKKFWEYRNYFEIAERFEYADNNFREGNDAGRKTDRGRVYVKYGEPDEIEVSTGEYYESRSYEYWQYYNGPQFLFLDIRGTSEYTLVWTNVTDEQSQPTLYKYIPPYIRDIVR